MDDYKIALGALLDANAKGDIDKQLNAIKDLSVTISKATLSNDVINDIKRQLTQNGIDLKLVFGNVGQITNQAKQTGQQIGQQIQSGINSAIQKGNLQKDFFFSADKKNGVAKRAQEYFRGVSNGIVTVTEQMTNLDNNSELRGFIVNIKNAKGEVESLRYSLRNITDDNGNVTGQKFAYTGGAINDAGAIKQIQAIENAFADYTAKLAQFKSTNTNILSGLTTPLQDFETKLVGLKNGTATIDEVKNSFKLLGTEASKVTANFTGQLSKTDAAIRKLSQGDEIMDGLKASFKGLSNAPKDINTELNKVSKLLREVRNVESQEGRTANWSAKYREWSDEVDKLKAKLSVLQKQQASMTTPQIFKTSDLRSADIPYMTKVSNTIEKQMGEIQKMANAKGWQNFEVKGIEKADGQIKSLTLTVREADGALKQFEMQRAKLQGSGKAQTGLMQVGDVKIIETASQAQAKLAQQTENANAKLQEQVNKIQLSMSGEGKGKSYGLEIEELIQKYRKLGFTEDEAKQKIKELSNAHNNLSAVINKNVTDFGSLEAKNQAIINANEKRTLALNKVNNEYKEMALTAPKILTNIQRLNKVESMQKWADNNSKAMKKYGTEINRIIQRFAQLDVQMNSIESDKLVTEFKQLQEVARKTGNLGMTAFDKFKGAWEKFGGWSLATGALTKTLSGMKRVGTEAINLDNNITDLIMATGLHKDQLDSLLDSYSDLSDRLNATITDVIASGMEWLKQGKSIAETEQLISSAMILDKVGKIGSSEQSTKYLTSAMKGYKVEAEDTLKIVDKLSAVDMASATDVGGLAEGMSEVAASADLAGVSMDKLLGYLATVGEVTQEGMSQVGTTFNAIFSRMGNIKLARLKDYQNSGEDLSNVETVLRGEGISLRETTGEFRNFGEVLDEVAKNWTSYSEVSQRAIASAFSGTHHMNEFIILMENYGSALEYTEISMESSGEAMQKFEAYQQSVTAHTEIFNKSIQDLANTAIDSGLVNWFIDLGTTGVKSIDGLISILGGMDGVLGASGGIALNKMLG